MNTYKKLLGNSVIFAIGNLGSKFISIILVPLYTYYLSTSEYGMIDVVTVTTNMLLPIISLSIYEAVLRFVMDKNHQKDEVFTNALMLTISGSIITLLTYPILNYLGILDGLLGYMFIILVLQAFNSLFAQFVRAIGELKIYSLNGILMTIATAVMNIILLVIFKMGISGYFLSTVIGILISSVFLLFFTKMYKCISINKLNKHLAKKMLVYCIPLIPNSLMWWIVNSSNRYFILFFEGTSANGIFAVANKIPSILSILCTIFFQAWQLSAIEEFNSKDKSKFYSEVFSYFSMITFIVSSGILMGLKYIMKFVVSPEFYLSWQFVPLLLVSVIFSGFSSFLGTNYIAAKQTNGVFKTSIIGGILNILSSLILIPSVGINGASISAMISFFVIWVLRVYDTKQFINMILNIKSLFINLLLIFIQIFVLYLRINLTTEFIIELILFLLLILVNKSLFIPIKKFIKFSHTSFKRGADPYP